MEDGGPLRSNGLLHEDDIAVKRRGVKVGRGWGQSSFKQKSLTTNFS